MRILAAFGCEEKSPGLGSRRGVDAVAAGRSSLSARGSSPSCPGRLRRTAATSEGEAAERRVQNQPACTRATQKARGRQPPRKNGSGSLAAQRVLLARAARAVAQNRTNCTRLGCLDSFCAENVVELPLADVLLEDLREGAAASLGARVLQRRCLDNATFPCCRDNNSRRRMGRQRRTQQLWAVSA